jgi:serine/threonine protein kinase
MLRLFQLLYTLTVHNGAFGVAKYHPSKDSRKSTTLASKNNDDDDELVGVNVCSIKPNVDYAGKPDEAKVQQQRVVAGVQLAKFKKTKLLGEGGMSKVYLGVYDGAMCVGKIVTRVHDSAAVNTMLHEVAVFEKLQRHPHCMYMIGAKTTLEDGGSLVLTELCESGSVFDMYCKHGMCVCLYIHKCSIYIYVCIYTRT